MVKHIIPDLQTLVQDVSELTSPPKVWLKINEVMRDDNCSTADIAQVIQHDPALTSSLLKLVNSAFYNFPSRIDTISRAISIIGMNDLFSLITAISATRVFTNIPSGLTRSETFWRHAIVTGILARRIAAKCRILHTERLYVAGILHDVGSLVLYGKLPELSSEILMIAGGDEEVLYQAENDVIGFTHAMLGAELLTRWNLPEALVNAIRFHHEPLQAGNNILDASILCLANQLANQLEYGSLMDESPAKQTDIDPQVWKITGLDESEIIELLESLEDEVEIVLSIMTPGKAHAT